MHPLDQAIALQHFGGDEFAGQVSPDYWNMVGPFGGVTAATLLNAVMLHPSRLGDPVALTVNYAAGASLAPFRVQARAVRTNRSTQHWVIEQLQTNDQGQSEVVTTATVVTAVRRSTWSVDEVPMPLAPPASQLKRFMPPGVAGVKWLGLYDMRLLQGQIPMQWDDTGEHSVTRLWMRDEPARPLDFVALAALADLFYPRIWLRRARRVPAGTVSMTVYFHASSAELGACGDGFLMGQASAQAFRNGFFDQTAQLWGPHGGLIATTHQTVYYKE